MQGHYTYVRFNRAEGIVGCLGAGSRNRVKERRLTYVGQADDAYGKSHGTSPTQL